MIAKPALPLLGLTALLGCGSSAGGSGSHLSGARPSSTPAVPAVPASVPSSAALPRVVFVGTSLTAGFGLDPDQAYPALVQKKVDAEGLHYQVVNAGVSGETSAGARRRIGWVLQKPAAVLVLETGANDGLRGQDVEELRANIQAILDRARQQSPPPRVILVGMATLTNYGPDYGRRFQAVYAELARSNHVGLVPFLLEGVAGNPALNQSDGVHPTAEGQRRLAENVWKVLGPLLRSGA